MEDFDHRRARSISQSIIRMTRGKSRVTHCAWSFHCYLNSTIRRVRWRGDILGEIRVSKVPINHHRTEQSTLTGEIDILESSYRLEQKRKHRVWQRMLVVISSCERRGLWRITRAQRKWIFKCYPVVRFAKILPIIQMVNILRAISIQWSF